MGDSMTILDLILAALCAFRLTQLLVWDVILDPLTSWLSSRSPFLGELLACAHCTGYWCSAFTVVLLSVVKSYPGSILAASANFILWAFAVAGAVSIVQHATCWLDVGGQDAEG